MAAERILVVQTAFLGDIVLTTPFLRELRRLEPRAEISLLTTPAGAALLDPVPWNVRLIPFDKRGGDRGFRGFGRKAWELRRDGYDLAFCLHRSLRSALLSRAVGCREVWGFREAPGRVLYHRVVSRVSGAYEAEKNLEMLSARYGTRFSLEEKLPELTVSPRDEESASRLLGEVNRFAVVAPSSVWATKRWPARRFGALAARFSGRIPVVILAGGSREEQALCRELEEAHREAGGKSLLNLAGKTSLGEMKAVLRRASFAVTNDSAPLHMAIALGAPGVAVFGPTVRSQGFFPLAPEGRWLAVEKSGLECRPCGAHGHARCPQGHFDCMLGLEVEEVFRMVEKLPWRNG